MADKTQKNEPVPAELAGAPTCGIVMPIAQMDGFGINHWAEVKGIILEAVESLSQTKFSGSVVSESAAVGVIHTRIVTNLYTSSIVVCDVSGRNPNVMFELGMRLAFDKPVVIIKDKETPFSFDSGPIEHLEYPRDLRYGAMQTFKAALAERVHSTYQSSLIDPDGPSFLKSFGTFKLPRLSTEDVEPYELIMAQLQEIRSDMATLAPRPYIKQPISPPHPREIAKALIEKRLAELKRRFSIKDWRSLPPIEKQNLLYNVASEDMGPNYPLEDMRAIVAHVLDVDEL